MARPGSKTPAPVRLYLGDWGDADAFLAPATFFSSRTPGTLGAFFFASPVYALLVLRPLLAHKHAQLLDSDNLTSLA